MTRRPADIVMLGEADEPFTHVNLYAECIDAGNRASHQFDPHYPGWKLYTRIARGDARFDRDLSAWAVRMARMYTRCRKVGTGQAVVAPRGRRNEWVAAAGMDALLFVIYGRWPDSFAARAATYCVDDETYKRVTVALGQCMLAGFEHYRSELHYAMSRVRREYANI